MKVFLVKTVKPKLSGINQFMQLFSEFSWRETLHLCRLQFPLKLHWYYRIVYICAICPVQGYLKGVTISIDRETSK